MVPACVGALNFSTVSTSPEQSFGADHDVAVYLGRTIDPVPAIPSVPTGRTPSSKAKPLPTNLKTAASLRPRPRPKAPGGFRLHFGRVLYLREPVGYAKPLPMQALFWPCPVPGSSIPLMPAAISKKRLRPIIVPQMWILDTGGGRDLIGKNDLE